MSISDIESRLTTNLPRFHELDSKVKFDFGGDGVMLIDGTQNPATLSRTDGEADCTIQIAEADMTKMLNGELDPTFAFMTGKLKVKGSTAIAMKLGPLLAA